MNNYSEFLKSKLAHVKPSGFNVDRAPSFLFDFQKFIFKLALNKGKYAVFAGTGTGKSAVQLAWAHEVAKHTKKPVLIVAPLAVAKQTAHTEANKFGIDCKYCYSGGDVINGINITNYQKLDKFDCSIFSGVVLDESSILKSFTGSTRNQLIDTFNDTPYKLACSATPSPNDYMELGNHAEFLGIMSRTEMSAQYFIHDSSDTSKWRLKKHANNPFWKWLAEWSVMLEKPSDLGFSDDQYQLPQLIEHEIKIETDIKREGELFSLVAHGLTEQRKIKKLTLESRVKAIASLVNNSDEQWLVWCETNDESAALKKAIADAVEVKGSDKDRKKESAALEFAAGELRVLISKPSIFGFGMNWQNCHNIAFVGISNSFELTYQAIRRCYRFGQEKDVNVYFAVTDTCLAIKQNIERKKVQFAEMMTELIKHMGHYNLDATKAQKNEYKRDLVQGNNFKLYMGDCVDVISEIKDNSIDYSIFSPPFASLYTYSNSERDMGNVRDNDEFFDHFDYLIQNLYRVLQPGRLLSFHCMNLPIAKQKHGYIGISDFRGDLIRAFQKHGFIFHSEVCIWKDPVVAMQRTKAIGLLHKQMKKDSSLSRQGIPDYLITMRKHGDNLKPIAGRLEQFNGTGYEGNYDQEAQSIEIWQRYASPVWMDINQSDVLQFRQARDNNDERHICPLQLGVIRRALQLWSNPGDLVLSPFAGIGSEGYVSLEMDRRFIGVELKESYFNIAKQNLEFIENKPKQLTLDVAV